jgi:hypothetical protein
MFSSKQFCIFTSLAEFGFEKEERRENFNVAQLGSIYYIYRAHYTANSYWPAGPGSCGTAVPSSDGLGSIQLWGPTGNLKSAARPPYRRGMSAARVSRVSGRATERGD